MSRGLLLAERIPNEEALAMAPTAGLLMLFLAVCALAIFIVNREGFRRIFLRAEDPRAMGLYRIAFGLCAVGNILEMWELYHYLFTDEGLFLTDVARHVFAREQFRGFSNGLDGEPYGFLDWAAVWQWLKGPKYSLLFFWDSPTAFWIHWTAFMVAMACFIVGYQTWLTKWVAWFLFHSIIQRNSVYWEGTENVYRVFFFYLCLSRCGQAYSVDNWLRCRRLRAQGRLSEPGKPGEGAGAPPSDDHPKGLEAIYRRIPAWPRMLVILNFGALYCYTGVVKNGSVWLRGDAFYYALNLDHFYRVPPQQLSAWFGTTLFRLNTHVVHVWESAFPIVIFGLFVRFGLREKLPDYTKTERIVHVVAWVLFGLGCLTLCEYLYPVHFSQPKNSIWTLQRVQWVFGISWVGCMALVAWLWNRLRYRPFKLTIRKRPFTIDLDAAIAWLMGRRVWLLLGIVFHLHLMVLMNIGWFQPGALAGFIAFLNGGEIALALAMIAGVLSRLGVPKAWSKPIPSQDPTLPHLHHDTLRLPPAPMIVAVVMAVVGVGLAYLGEHDARSLGERWAWLEPFGLPYGWTLVAIAVLLAGAMAMTIRQPSPHAPITQPWAHGPWGRFIAACLVTYQITGVACWLLPDKDSFEWRGHTHEPFTWWLRVTQTTQGWKMFAPNPPRHNRFLRVLVTDAEGEVWDMKTDVYASEQFPVPWIWYTRQRKINRRISGSEGGQGSWYQKWHARWFCRQWALQHGGEIPQQVELVKITYSIPSPGWAWKHGPYDPVARREQLGKQESLYTAKCATEVDAQAPNEIRERHGLPESPVKIKRWSAMRNRPQYWERHKAKQSKP